MHVTESVQTECAAPIVIAPKKDGALPLCVNYRKLIAVNVSYSYLLRRMDECIDLLGDARLFSMIDTKSGYRQIKLDEEDCNKTAFTSHCGLFHFICMRSEIKSPNGMLQRVMHVILATVKWKLALVYLNDIIIFSKSPLKQVDHVHQVLKLLSDVEVTLTLKKFSFFTDTMDYLGHIINPGKLAVVTHTSDTVRYIKEPPNVTELQSCLIFVTLSVD